VRYATGALGKSNRKKTMKNRKETIRKLEQPGDAVVRRFPNGLRHNKDFGAYPIRGVKRALLLFDVHAPYHDEEALELAVQHGVDSGCDCVILVGDFMDFYACSFWEKDPRQRDFAGELKMGREMLKSIREAFPGKQIIYKLGNHEERYERWMIAKAPELLGVEDFQIQKLLRLDELNIRMMDYRAPITLGKLNIIHGHEFGKSMTNPVNPSRGLFLKGKSQFDLRALSSEQQPQRENDRAEDHRKLVERVPLRHASGLRADE
jgi:predicted phosphodiesterase